MGESFVQEPIEFTDQNYSFTGPDSIASLLALFPDDQFVWHGFAPGDELAQGARCDKDRPNNEVSGTVAELPMVIEGVVTLHPRFFQKRTVCGFSDERFYGSYVLQDSTAGIVVLKDSRVSDFTYGARVRLRVRGIMRNAFGVGVPPFLAVVAFDEEEVISTGNPIYYEPINRNFELGDIGQVTEIRGRIISESNNNNFNELLLEHPTDPSIQWLVSLDRELGQRNPPLYEGCEVTLRGPVLESYGFRMLVASYGQIDGHEACLARRIAQSQE